ncbi:hypothetical protein QL285_014674 [Trifolium repens]|nr:hypothetical protein QL285_014674 [Trifolium repens]
MVSTWSKFTYLFSYTGYAINGYTFYTKEHDDESTMQNSGVTLVAKSMHISSAKDINPAYANLSYFGVIERIWEFDYSLFRVAVFGCKWVENKKGVLIDESGFLRVDLTRRGYEDEPFILASQAKQVFYVTNPANIRWSIVLLTNKISDDNNEDQDDTAIEDDPFLGTLESLKTGPTTEDDLYIRDDHDEGILINQPFHVTKEQTNRILKKKRKR